MKSKHYQVSYLKEPPYFLFDEEGNARVILSQMGTPDTSMNCFSSRLKFVWLNHQVSKRMKTLQELLFIRMVYDRVGIQNKRNR